MSVPTPPLSPVNIGDVVDKYRVERVIGFGAMGVVVAARHATLDQVVAIKFLVEHRFGTADESIGRFVAEARAAARIQSDHVCRVSDVGMLPSGVPYMIMEYLEGNDLEAEIVARGQLEIVEAVDYVLQALDAMAAAHGLGIVHRDLKPANLFLARRPDGTSRVKVLDFGISKAIASKHSRTRETRSLGTPAYMPPEQIIDPARVDHRADLWALGAILYEVLTGEMAFVGESVQKVLDRVMTEESCPIPALRADVPAELIGIVRRALARDRDDRWPTAATFARALAPFGSIGVLSGLASIQREVGSLASLSSIPVAAAVSSHFPHAQSLPPTATAHGPTLEPTLSSIQAPAPADPDEVSRRHVIVQDWGALQARRRKARAAVLVMVSIFFVGSSVALVAYRGARVRSVKTSATAPSTGVHTAPSYMRSAGNADSSTHGPAARSPRRSP